MNHCLTPNTPVATSVASLKLQPWKSGCCQKQMSPSNLLSVSLNVSSKLNLKTGCMANLFINYFLNFRRLIY